MVKDARGVDIAAHDTAIYGFGVGSSVAMAEGVVLGEHADHRCVRPYDCLDSVKLSPSGRIYIRIIRRSCYSGTKPVVDVAPDRVVVLKAAYNNWEEKLHFRLPDSTLPTQTDVARAATQRLIDLYVKSIRNPEANCPDRWDHLETREAQVADYAAWCSRQLAKYRKELKALED